uniref:ATP synthase subunit a n=1 Tax=Silene vulgaris TaxID=42043 RepID=U5HST6_SILVU|nr:ATPase subunit 6 [Silene vulgaris]
MCPVRTVKKRKSEKKLMSLNLLASVITIKTIYYAVGLGCTAGFLSRFCYRAERIYEQNVSLAEKDIAAGRNAEITSMFGSYRSSAPEGMVPPQPQKVVVVEESGSSYKSAASRFSEGGTSTDAASPLEQFDILPLFDIKLGNLYFSFTNPSLFMLLTLSLVLLLLYFVTKKGGGKSVPNVWQSLVELIYDFVLNLVNEQIVSKVELSGNVKQKFFPCILVTFTFLLFRNLQGMIPYSFTVTSHFLITLGLSFSIFIGITIVGFQRNGLHFLSFSLPAGVPLPLAPFLVLLELIPHCFRALSLGIRLFANMMAGHSSVKILSGFAWTMLCMNDLLYFIGDLGPLFIVLALTGLELGVAILQAHVFTILICIYLNDATNLH